MKEQQHYRQQQSNPPGWIDADPKIMRALVSKETVETTPLPPPVGIVVKNHRALFAIDTKNMNIVVNKKLPATLDPRVPILHELKHASQDGLPHTPRRHLRHIAILASAGIPLERAQDLLNVVYDCYVDSLVNRKYKVKDNLNVILALSDIRKLEGSLPHIAMILYKHLGLSDADAPPETAFEKSLVSHKKFPVLIQCLNQLDPSCDREITNAAALLNYILEDTAPPPACNPQQQQPQQQQPQQQQPQQQQPQQPPRMQEKENEKTRTQEEKQPPRRKGSDDSETKDEEEGEEKSGREEGEKRERIGTRGGDGNGDADANSDADADSDSDADADSDSDADADSDSDADADSDSDADADSDSDADADANSDGETEEAGTGAESEPESESSTDSGADSDADADADRADSGADEGADAESEAEASPETDPASGATSGTGAATGADSKKAGGGPCGQADAPGADGREERSPDENDEDLNWDNDANLPVNAPLEFSGSVEEVVEIAYDHNAPEIIEGLLGIPPEKALEEAARRALWKAARAFQGKGTVYKIKEPDRRRWLPWHARRLDPASIARNPLSPERWQERVLTDTIQTDEEGEEGGFSAVRVIIDTSGSMIELHGDRTRLALAKQAAMGLVALARQHGLPVEVFEFNTELYRCTPPSLNYLKHAKAILCLSPRGITNVQLIAQAIARQDPGTLTAVITDGEFKPEALAAAARSVPRSKIICACLNKNAALGLSRAVQTSAKNLEFFYVKKDFGIVVEKAKTALGR